MAVVNQILHRKNTSGTYDTVYLQSNLGNVTGTLAVANGGTGNTSVDTTPTDGSTKMCTSGGIYTEIQTLKTSVSNGKAAVAGAITDKGVSTSATASFDTMATNISTIPTGTPRSSSDLTVSGATVSVPAGLYSAAASKSVASGVLGTVSADKSISGNTATITPKIGAGTAGYNDMSAKNGTAVTVTAAEVCNSGTKNITANGTGINVTGYSKVNVNVPGIIPSGTLIIADGGTYDVTNYASVSVWTPGSTILWDNKTWLVCHYDSSNNQIYLIAKDIISNTKFSNNKTYAGSTLASAASTYQTNNMSAAALAKCVNVTVNGVTSKVFVPSYEQMDGGFSWFNIDANRIAQYQGRNTAYWTSSAYSSSNYVWMVYTAGSLDYSSPSSSLGFRPCVCVQL